MTRFEVDVSKSLSLNTVDWGRGATEAVWSELDGSRKTIALLTAALREIETICTESAGDCRRRMGTRVGNSLVTAREALDKVASHV